MDLYLPNDFKQQPDMHDMETQASPTMINMRQSDLRIVIDNTMAMDEPSPSNSFSKVKDSVERIVEMVEKIKLLARSKITVESHNI